MRAHVLAYFYVLTVVWFVARDPIGTCALSTTAASEKPFRSPLGVEKVVIYPRVHFPDDGATAIDGCRNASVNGMKIFQDPDLRPWSGLHNLSITVFQEWNTRKIQSAKSLRYADKRMLAELSYASSDPSERGLSYEDENNLLSCVARRMLISSFTMYQAICSCQSELQEVKYCAAVDFFVLNVHCHDAFTAAADLGVCKKLLTPDYGVQLSKMCSGWVAGVVSALDLNLMQLNLGTMVPDDIDGNTVKQEARSYYLAWKALQRLSHWADAHLICGPADSEGKLATDYQDVELLPEWKPLQYVWSHDINGAETPLAVLAKRNEANFLTAVRDVKTTMEGRFMETNRFAFTNLKEFDGRVHLGVANVAILMFPTYFKTLKEELDSVTGSTQPQITFVGSGSYGSGISAVLGYLTKRRLEQIGYKAEILYNAIFFESGGVGDETFAAKFGETFNVRNVVSSHSTLSSLPCSNTHGCGIGDTQIYTGNTGERIGTFMKFPGRVTFNLEAVAGGAWNTPYAGLEVLAHKACAPSCWFYSTACPDDPNPMCTPEECPAHFTPTDRAY